MKHLAIPSRHSRDKHGEFNSSQRPCSGPAGLASSSRQRGSLGWVPSRRHPWAGDLSHALAGPQLDLREEWAGSSGALGRGELLQAWGWEGCAPRSLRLLQGSPRQMHTAMCERAQLRGAVPQPRGRGCRRLHAQPCGPGWEPSWPELSRADPQRAGAPCWLAADGQARARTRALGGSFFPSWNGVVTWLMFTEGLFVPRKTSRYPYSDPAKWIPRGTERLRTCPNKLGLAYRPQVLRWHPVRQGSPRPHLCSLTHVSVFHPLAHLGFTWSCQTS